MAKQEANKRWAVVVVTAAVVGIGSHLAFCAGAGDPGAPASAPADEPGEQLFSSPSRAPVLSRDRRTAFRGVRPSGGVRFVNTLANYRKYAIYPPTSRPLKHESLDLLLWNQRYERFRPTRNDPSLSFRLSADRFWVTGEESINATLQVRRAGKPVTVEITRSFIGDDARSPGTDVAARVPVTFRRSGGAYVASFNPSALVHPERGAKLGLYVEFDSGASARQRAKIMFNYTPPGGIPARFTGAFREAIDHGSLIIYAQVEVARAGWYLIDCNLWDRLDNPVAWTRFKGNLSTGLQEVPLLFFGKVLVDSKSIAPWHIGELRGGLHVPMEDPDVDFMQPFTGSYRTSKYDLAQFSNAEWDSAQKRKKLQLLREYEDDPNAPKLPVPGGPAEH